MRSMMSLNSSLYLAAETTFTFQAFILNKFLSVIYGVQMDEVDVGTVPVEELKAD